MKNGTPLEACLAMHPAEAAELSSLLQIVAGLQALAAPAPAVNAAAAQAARARFLARAKTLAQPAPVPAEDALAMSAAMLASGLSPDECLDAFPHHAGELRPSLDVVAALQQAAEPAPDPDPVARATARERFLAQAMALSQSVETPVEDALEASLGMIAAGQTIEDCLQTFPHCAGDLRPALAIAGALQTQLAEPVPVRPARAIVARRKAFLASASAARRAAARQQAGAGWQQMLAGLFRQPAWARAGVILLLVLMLVGFTRVAVTTAAGALPGDALYPVKLAAEQARLLVTLDEGQRAALRQQFEQSRREEAATVAEQRRQVQVQFTGVIESMVDGAWRIAGLEAPVLVPGDAVVRGQPAVGAQVIVLAYSDGSGNLTARQAIILGPADAAPPTATATSTRTPRIEPPAVAPPLLPAPTRTPSARPTDRATLVVPRWTRTPTPTRTGTPTTTGTPTVTGTPTTTGTPTVTVRPRDLYGAIEEKTAAWWRIDGEVVLITADTLIDESQGPAVIGAIVRAVAMPRPDGTLEATLIVVQSGAAQPVERDYFTDVIYAIGASQWLIGNRSVNVTGETEIVGDPEVGRTARVWLERPAGGTWTATRIEIEQPPSSEPVYFEGEISAIGASSWVVAGRTILITGSTVIVGATPQVGYWAEVEARPIGESLVALFINVVEPAATSTPRPTSTPTSLPSETATTEPTSTATPEPPTATPEPPTATPEPPTATPEPPTATPEPPTATPEPPTATPEPPTATPGATATPEPPPDPSPAPKAPAAPGPPLRISEPAPL